MGRGLGRLVHRLGHGPDATVLRLLKELQDRDEALVKPAHLRHETGGELEKGCRKILKYTLPSVSFLFVVLAGLISIQGLSFARPN
jgi:hypothetical protein